MSKGTRGWEGSVGFLVAVCEARCGLAVEDTSKFVELHNILHKILVFFGILFLANSRHNMDNVVVRVLECQLGLRLSFLRVISVLVWRSTLRLHAFLLPTKI